MNLYFFARSPFHFYGKFQPTAVRQEQTLLYHVRSSAYFGKSCFPELLPSREKEMKLGIYF